MSTPTKDTIKLLEQQVEEDRYKSIMAANAYEVSKELLERFMMKENDHGAFNGTVTEEESWSQHYVRHSRKRLRVNDTAPPRRP